jgi:hypothetical protein
MKRITRRSLIQQAFAYSALASCSMDKKKKHSVGGAPIQPDADDGSAKEGPNSAGLFDPNERFLIVLGCFGGASINDSFMALSESQVKAAGGDPGKLNCFSDQQLVRLSGSELTAVKIQKDIDTLGGYKVDTDQSTFLKKHVQDMLVVTTNMTSVNHGVAQMRSLTGNDAWRGRTLQEAVALQYGKNKPLANINMGSGGYSFVGIDKELPEYARQYTVSDPKYWPLGLHSSIGLSTQIESELLQLARDSRNGLEEISNFNRTFKGSAEVVRWKQQRLDKIQTFEQLDLVNRLFFLEQNGSGIEGAKEAKMLRELFPNYGIDHFEAQAMMAYLAITSGVASAVTLSPNSAALTSGNVKDFINPPIAFDFSHTDHRGTQAMMWDRMLSVADKLITLLKAMEFNPLTGESFWDRSMIYFATEFGRSKNKEPGSETFASAHDLNNGSLIMSPFVNGNSVLGAVDSKSILTHGFDLNSGEPVKGRLTSEKEFYTGVLTAMDVDLTGSGLPTVTAFKKS